MSVAQCRFCDHVNPAGSKFCAECGGALHLLPCPRCGAVSQVTATVCYQCQAPLPWHAAEAPAPFSPSAESSATSNRWRSRAMIAAVVGAAAVALVYYGYRQPLPDEPAATPGAKDTASGAAVRAAGVVKDPSPAVIDANASGSAPIAVPTAVPTNAPAKPSGRAAQPARSPATPTAVERNPTPSTLNPGRIAPPTPARIASCTESIAALGLCALEPGQGKVMETTVTRAETTPVPALDGAQSGGLDASRQSCPEAQEALGLCTPRSSQGGN
jgi:hypothetical protein